MDSNEDGLIGKVRPLDMHDQITGHHIRISVNERYTTFSVNGRDYYFNSDTGEFDGTGMMVPERPTHDPSNN